MLIIILLIILAILLALTLVIICYLIRKLVNQKNGSDIVDFANKNLPDLNDQIFLLGEDLLERTLSNMAQANEFIWERQYKMANVVNKNNVIVDIFIHGANKHFNIAIDCKLPLQTYLRATDTKDYETFITSMKKHITDVSKKYVSVLDRTPFAILYLPSDKIYSYLFGREFKEIIKFALDRNVLIAGPTNLTAILHAANFYLQQVDEIANYHEKMEVLDMIKSYMTGYDKHLLEAKKSAENFTDVLGKLAKDEKKFTKIFKKLRGE